MDNMYSDSECNKIHEIFDKFKSPKSMKTFIRNKNRLHELITLQIFPITKQTEKKCKLLLCDLNVFKLLIYYGEYWLLCSLFINGRQYIADLDIKCTYLFIESIAALEHMQIIKQNQLQCLNFAISMNRLYGTKNDLNYGCYLFYLTLIIVDHFDDATKCDEEFEDATELRYKSYFDILRYLFCDLYFMINEKSTDEQPPSYSVFINDITATLGYLMTFCCNPLYSVFQTNSMERIKELWIDNDNNLNMYCHLFKSWDARDIFQIGKMYANIASTKHDSVLMGAKNQKVIYTTVTTPYILAKICVLDNKYKFAKQDLIFCALRTESYYLRILALKDIVINCFNNAEYLVGLKVFNILHRLCVRNGQIVIINSFFGKNYGKKLKHIKLKCFVCKKRGNDGMKIKCCMGCMKMFYCSKKCQKYDWNNKHRKYCHKSWQDAYQCLKSKLFK